MISLISIDAGTYLEDNIILAILCLIISLFHVSMLLLFFTRMAGHLGHFYFYCFFIFFGPFCTYIQTLLLLSLLSTTPVVAVEESKEIKQLVLRTEYRMIFMTYSWFYYFTEFTS